MCWWSGNGLKCRGIEDFRDGYASLYLLAIDNLDFFTFQFRKYARACCDVCMYFTLYFTIQAGNRILNEKARVYLNREVGGGGGEMTSFLVYIHP